MEESGKKSNLPSQEEQEENPPLENNQKWTREFSRRKDMKKMTPWNVLDYNTKHLRPSSFSHEMEEMLLKEVAKYMLKSEYRTYSMAFTLKIPYSYTFWIYFMTFKQMSMSSSAPWSLSEFNLEVGRRLLRFTRNVYFRQRSLKNLKYFYRYLLPQCCTIQPFYFEWVSEAFHSPAEKKCSVWNVAKIKSLWQDDTSEFKQHLFQLITRIVSSDYARHLNYRRDFLPNAADVLYMYTHTVVVKVL